MDRDAILQQLEQVGFDTGLLSDCSDDAIAEIARVMGGGDTDDNGETIDDGRQLLKKEAQDPNMSDGCPVMKNGKQTDGEKAMWAKVDDIKDATGGKQTGRAKSGGYNKKAMKGQWNDEGDADQADPGMGTADYDDGKNAAPPGKPMAKPGDELAVNPPPVMPKGAAQTLADQDPGTPPQVSNPPMPQPKKVIMEKPYRYTEDQLSRSWRSRDTSTQVSVTQALAKFKEDFGKISQEHQEIRTYTESEAASRKKLAVDTFAESMVKAGKVLPSQKPAIIDRLTRADGKQVVRKFTEKGKATVSLTELDLQMAEIEKGPALLSFAGAHEE